MFAKALRVYLFSQEKSHFAPTNPHVSKKTFFSNFPQTKFLFFFFNLALLDFSILSIFYSPKARLSLPKHKNDIARNPPSQL
jgi:hypothetical protein